MMAFLDHLAGIALGATPAGAARPSLPPRFAASPAVGAVQGLEVVKPVSPMAQTTRALQEPVRGAQGPAPPAAPILSREPVSPAAVGSPLSAQPAQPVATEIQPVRREVSSPPSPSVVDGGERPLPAESFPPAGGEPAASSQPVSAARSRPAPPHLEVEAIIEHRVMRTAPLSAGVVAGRVMAVREQAPVIHVTIDRLDVRAPVRAEAARQRPRPQSAVSLSDYLRDGSSGGRR